MTPATTLRPPSLVRLSAFAALASVPLAIAFFINPSSYGASFVPLLLEGRDFAIALGALGGVVVLGDILQELARDDGYGSLGRRVTISLFAGVVVACIGLAVALPPSPASGTLALMTLFGALALIGHVGAIAWASTREPLLRTTLGLGLFAFLASTAAIALSRFPFAAAEPFASAVLWLPRVAELAWLVAPIAVLTDTRVAMERMRLGRALTGWLIALVLLGPVFVVLAARRETLRLFVEALSHVTLFAETRLVLIYPAFFLMTASLACVQLLQRDPFRVHVGAAGLFWLVAGAAPRTPVRALYAALFFLLLARVARSTRDIFGTRPSAPRPPAPVDDDTSPPPTEALH